MYPPASLCDTHFVCTAHLAGRGVCVHIAWHPPCEICHAVLARRVLQGGVRAIGIASYREGCVQSVLARRVLQGGVRAIGIACGRGAEEWAEIDALQKQVIRAPPPPIMYAMGLPRVFTVYRVVLFTIIYSYLQLFTVYRVVLPWSYASPCNVYHITGSWRCTPTNPSL
jgi:hypothetical protein